jgi:GxxExxY protein
MHIRRLCGNSHRYTQMNTDNFKYKDITSVILKGFYEVYNELGDGFIESVYENALTVVLAEHGLLVENQKSISVYFRGHNIGDFKTDLIINGKVIVELKAIRSLDPVHEAQLINYLKATNIEVGLLLNFGRKPEFKRFVYSNKRKNISDNQRKSVAERE